MKKYGNPKFWPVLVLLVLLLSSCAPAVNPSSGPMVETMGTQGHDDDMYGVPEGGVPQTGSELDELFINMMVPHHQGAVAMANIALERAEHPEIKDMANAIIASQQAEINQMKSWKQKWYGSSETPPMSAMPMLEEMPGMGGMGHTMDMQADVDVLKNAAEPFDLAFIDAMIPHHQSAIDAARKVLETGVHPEMKELAQQIIDAQQSEIDQMKSWRQSWYPDAPPSP